ncbi:hypothetical protein [Methylophaga sp.]|uniref:hypothetical protein n=1 Tax=Methylophaga sp. TaxID=2024840 RepID=UPI003F69DBC0
MKILSIAFMLSLFVSLGFPVNAEETKIMIRAKAADAKYIGTSVGGVRVVVEDAETGEILNQGWINGDTGDTDVLIKNPIKRGQTLATETTAGFLAKVDINTPQLLRFKLIGPYGYRQSLQEASVTSWVIPGKDILGDGITLTMPGFIVDAWTQVLEGGKVEFYTKASLLCGCPITKDGLWKPDNYEAKAIIMQDEKKIDEVTLDFTGPVGLFSAKTEIKQSGHYKAIVYLIDQTTGNVGVDRTMFQVNLD